MGRVTGEPHTPVRLSTAIMAHPKRARWAYTLAAKIKPQPAIVWDRHNDRWDTGRRALLAYDPKASHHLVVQDDAVIPRRLTFTVRHILAHTPPDVPVSLYMGRHRHRPKHFSMTTVVDAARLHGASFACFGGPWWGPAIILPTAHVEAVVAYGDENPHNEPNYDLRIAQFYASKGIDCWYTMPSIVDHREGPSLTGRKGKRRFAEWFEHDPSGIDWSGGVVTPEHMTFRGNFPRTP